MISRCPLKYIVIFCLEPVRHTPVLPQSQFRPAYVLYLVPLLYDFTIFERVALGSPRTTLRIYSSFAALLLVMSSHDLLPSVAFVPTPGAAAPVVTAPAARPALSSQSHMSLTLAPPATLSLASSLTTAPTRVPLVQHTLAPIASKFMGGSPAGAPSGTIVVLFRADLRVDDHAPLVHALEEAASVVPVFCFDPRHFGRTAYGFEKTGRYRACFLLDSIKALRQTFQELGSDIIVRIGRPEEVVPDICKRVGAKRVFLHAETTYEEQRVEDELEDTLKEFGAELKRFWGNTLYHIDDLPFPLDAIPDVYSDFRESVETKGKIRKPLPAPEELSPLPSAVKRGQIPTLADLQIDDAPDCHIPGSSNVVMDSASYGVGSILGGEPEALRRVRNYVDELRRSDSGIVPRAKASSHLGADFSCRISPWLALGCVSPRRIYEELCNVTAMPTAVSRSATYFELVWRDFFRFITCKYSASRLRKSTPTPHMVSAASLTQ